MVVEGSYYSVPYRWIGKTVDVYTGPRIVEIYAGMELIATHLAAGRKGERQTRMEHYPESKRAYLENPPERCRERATQVGPACAQVVRYVFERTAYTTGCAVCKAFCVCRNASARNVWKRPAGEPCTMGMLRIAALKRFWMRVWIRNTLKKTIQQVIHLASYRFARPASTFFAREAPSC